MCPRKLSMLATTTTLLGLVLASCSPSPATIAVTTRQATAAEPAAKAPAGAPTPSLPTAILKPAAQASYGGVATRVMPRDVTSFDVQRESGADVSLTLFNVYQGLVRLHPIEHQKIESELAEQWEVSADGRVLTFKFYKGITWHDGKPFTMEDVKYSLDRMHNPKAFNTVSPRGEGLLKAMDDVGIVDENTIKITLKYSSASFLPNIAAGWVAMEPKHILAAKGDTRRDLVGTGPFKLKEFNPSISLELEKNTNYHVKGLPYLDGIKFYTVKDAATRFSAFRTGKAIITFAGINGLSPTQADIVKGEMADKATVYEHDAQTRQVLIFNMGRKPWDDVRVRKAVDLAFDHQAAIKINGRGYAGSIYETPWGMRPEEVAKLPGYRQPKDADVAEAKKLMAEAGFSAGFKTTLLSPTGVPERQAVVAKDQLAKIGIDAEVTLAEYATLWERAGRRTFDLISATWTDNTNDPDETLYTYYTTGGSRNYGDFSDKAMDDLIDKQASTLDTKAREAILADIERKIIDQVPMVIAFWDVFQAGAWKEVKDFRPGPGIHSWGKLDQVWLAR